MYEDLTALAQKAGFAHIGFAPIRHIETHPELRKYCEENRCGNYGANWACPPACGSVIELSDRLNSYTTMMLLQSVIVIDYTNDPELLISRMREHELDHRAQFCSFANLVKERYHNALFLSAGPCRRCEECSYPDVPCRFPDDLYPPMEAAGLLISDICKEADISSPFSFGPQTLAPVSCICLP